MAKKSNIIGLIGILLFHQFIGAMKSEVVHKAESSSLGKRITSLMPSDLRNSPELFKPKGLGIWLVNVCRRGKFSADKENSVLNTFLKRKADLSAVDDQGTALMWAAYHGKLETVKRLVQNGAELEASAANQWTPLHAATQQGHLDIVKYLVEQGAYHSAQSINGVTPLQLAVQENNLEMVRYFFYRDIDLEMQDSFGRTALHIAAWLGHTALCIFLIQIGADVNAFSSGGFTPLYAAATKGHKAIVEALLVAGADTLLISCDGLTAAGCASSKGHTACARLIKNKTAELINAKKVPIVIIRQAEETLGE